MDRSGEPPAQNPSFAADPVVGEFLEALEGLGARDQAVVSAIIARARHIELAEGECAARALLDDILAKLNADRAG